MTLLVQLAAGFGLYAGVLALAYAVDVEFRRSVRYAIWKGGVYVAAYKAMRA